MTLWISALMVSLQNSLKVMHTLLESFNIQSLFYLALYAIGIFNLNLVWLQKRFIEEK